MKVEEIITKSLKMLYDSLYTMVISLMVTQLTLLLVFGREVGLLSLFMCLNFLFTFGSMRLLMFGGITIKVSSRTFIIVLTCVLTVLFNAVPISPVEKVIESVYTDYLTDNEDYESVSEFKQDMYMLDNPSKLNTVVDVAKSYNATKYELMRTDITNDGELEKLATEERELEMELQIIDDGLSKYSILFYFASYIISLIGQGVSLMFSEDIIFKKDIIIKKRVSS